MLMVAYFLMVFWGKKGIFIVNSLEFCKDLNCTLLEEISLSFYQEYYQPKTTFNWTFNLGFLRPYK